MISACGLTKCYRSKTVLRDICFELPQPCALAVAGANGAGKTTLLRLLALLVKPDAGRVLFDGAPAGTDPLRRRVGYVTQANALFPELTVRENLRYWGGVPQDAMAILGLGEVEGVRVARLSGGMQRRLHLAIGLANDPALLIMDEPLTGVDIGTRQAVLTFFAALRDRGVTLIYSTHHADEIEGTADYLLLLREGALSFFGSVPEVRGRVDALLRESV